MWGESWAQHGGGRANRAQTRGLRGRRSRAAGEGGAGRRGRSRGRPAPTCRAARCRGAIQQQTAWQPPSQSAASARAARARPGSARLPAASSPALSGRWVGGLPVAGTRPGSPPGTPRRPSAALPRRGTQRKKGLCVQPWCCQAGSPLALVLSLSHSLSLLVLGPRCACCQWLAVPHPRPASVLPPALPLFAPWGDLQGQRRIPPSLPDRGEEPGLTLPLFGF